MNATRSNSEHKSEYKKEYKNIKRKQKFVLYVTAQSASENSLGRKRKEGKCIRKRESRLAKIKIKTFVGESMGKIESEIQGISSLDKETN